jgi:tRNA-modifying protein YgfZ
MNLADEWLYRADDWGVIEVSDSDRLNFLHNQSTNDFKSLKPGDQCDTVFVTSTARTIDLVTAYVLEDAVLLLVSPGMVEPLMKLLDRYIFFADKVKLRDVSAEKSVLRLVGKGCRGILAKLGAVPEVGQIEGTIGGQNVTIAVGCGLNLPGYTLICDVADEESVLAGLELPSPKYDWDELRIRQGRPIPGHELTDEFNPLEAGLWHTISFDKGCYIGQETIARLDSRNAVKQQLWGFQLDQSVEVGTPVMLDETKVGQVTSIIPSDAGFIGLAYVKTKAGGVGLAVTIDDRAATLADLPYLTRAKQA